MEDTSFRSARRVIRLMRERFAQVDSVMANNEDMAEEILNEVAAAIPEPTPGSLNELG